MSLRSNPAWLQTQKEVSRGTKKTSPPSVMSVKRRCMLLIFLRQFRIETKRNEGDGGMIYYFFGFLTKPCKYYLAMFSTCHVEPVVLHWKAGLQVIVSCPPCSDHKLFPPTFSSLVTISLSPQSLFGATIETIFVQPQCPIYHSLLSPHRSFPSDFVTTVNNTQHL